MKQIIIYGIGKMAELVYYSFRYDSQYEVIAFCVDDAYLDVSQNTLFGRPVMCFTDVREQFPPESYLMHIAVGRNDAREIIFNKVLEAKYDFANYICSKASVWPDLVLGRNVFIDQGSIVQPFVTIGDNCMLIIAVVGHHCHVGNHSLLSGTILAGSATVGNNCFLGMHSGVKEGIRVGNHNIVGAGCFISKNTKDGALIYLERTVQKTVMSKNIVLFNNEQKT